MSEQNMVSSNFTEPKNLEKLSFLWSIARMVLAAIALLLGGIPVLSYFVFRSMPYSPATFSLVNFILKLTWIISGAASAYLLYRWNANGKMLFGKKDSKDTAAFLVCVISGINLGLAGLISRNIGMSIFPSLIIFKLTALVYLVSVGYLLNSWKNFGKKLF